MAWMDKARRYGGLVWVAGGLVFQLWFLVTGSAVPEMVSWLPITAVLVLAAALVLPARPVVVKVAAWIVAALLAIELAGAVADRFGLFGRPGEPLVSWGTWSAFLDYTAQLLPWAPRPLVVTTAVLATIAEVALAAWLLSGRQRRWAGKAVAGLFAVYIVAMAPTVGWAAVATYAVPLLVGGALLVSSAQEPSMPERDSRTLAPTLHER